VKREYLYLVLGIVGLVVVYLLVPSARTATAKIKTKLGGAIGTGRTSKGTANSGDDSGGVLTNVGTPTATRGVQV
jgi:hypothetical protein